jgi:hypothetical protein
VAAVAGEEVLEVAEVQAAEAAEAEGFPVVTVEMDGQQHQVTGLVVHFVHHVVDARVQIQEVQVVQGHLEPAVVLWAIPVAVVLLPDRMVVAAVMAEAMVLREPVEQVLHALAHLRRQVGQEETHFAETEAQALSLIMDPV